MNRLNKGKGKAKGRGTEDEEVITRGGGGKGTKMKRAQPTCTQRTGNTPQPKSGGRRSFINTANNSLPPGGR